MELLGMCGMFYRICSRDEWDLSMGCIIVGLTT